MNNALLLSFFVLLVVAPWPNEGCRAAKKYVHAGATILGAVSQVMVIEKAKI